MAKGSQQPGAPGPVPQAMLTGGPSSLVPRVAVPPPAPRMQTQIANPVQPIPNAAGTNAPLGGITPSAALANAVQERFGSNGLPTGRIL